MPLPAAEREERALWLRLAFTSGAGPATARRLLETFGLPEGIFTAGRSLVSRLCGEKLAHALHAPDPARDAAVQAALDWARADHHHLITLPDSTYPQLLLKISDPPVVLFVQGDPAALNRPAIAIVGSRNATRTGMLHAESFARALGEAGLTVVSGLAQGIDAAAHRGALATAAGTVAVVGNGLARVYPSAHRELAERIAGLRGVAAGALVSELALDEKPLRANFPRRNRLIAGMVRGVLVVEAARQSGSLITARQATDYGREVMAIPGSIDAPLAKGCHQLLKEGARLVESAEDVLSELRGILQPGLGPPADTVQLQNRPPASLAALLEDPALPGFEPSSVDQLVLSSGLPPAQIHASLLAAELAGVVERLADGRYQRLPG